MSDDAEQSDTRGLPTLDKAPDASAEGTGAAPDATATGTVDDGRTGRFWSARRVPAGVVAPGVGEHRPAAADAGRQLAARAHRRSSGRSAGQSTSAG